MATRVIQVHSAAEAAQQLSGAPAGRLVVAYFTAAWCMPCQQIRPRVDQMSVAYAATVSFLKIDIDELPDVAQHAGVRAVPTFQFHKGGARLASFAGADVNRLEALVKQHQGGGDSGDAAGDAAAGPAGAAASGPSGGAGANGGGMIDLSSLIDKQQSSCLNQSQKNGFANVLVNSDSYLESDADEQLLMDVQFQQPVRLHSVKIVAKNAPFAPKSVKLFSNRINMGFEEAESSAATQEIELDAASVAADGPALELRFVKFQRVNNVVVFVKSNQGGEDTTRVNFIKFVGKPLEATDMNQLKKTEHDHS